MAGTTDSSKRMIRLWLRSWKRRARTAGAISRLELPSLRKYPPGLLCTNRLCGTSIRSTGTSRPSAFSSSTLRMSASSAGSTESLQISRTQPSTASSPASEMPWISRVLSDTPRITVPPRRLLAIAASSSAKSFRRGALTRLPCRATVFSSSTESSPRRRRRSSAGASWGAGVTAGRLSGDAAASRADAGGPDDHGSPALSDSK